MKKLAVVCALMAALLAACAPPSEEDQLYSNITEKLSAADGGGVVDPYIQSIADSIRGVDETNAEQRISYVLTLQCMPRWLKLELSSDDLRRLDEATTHAVPYLHSFTEAHKKGHYLHFSSNGPECEWPDSARPPQAPTEKLGDNGRGDN